MSYEGYEQYLCKNGHEWTANCYYSELTDGDGCPVCGEPIVWWNAVDLTNGSYDDEGNRIDGYVELEEAAPAKICTCPLCNTKHVIERTTYKIPNKK